MVFGNIFLNCSVLFLICISNISLQGFTSEQNIQIELREIGHEFLISLGDSTSRVMPISKDGERFRISFEREFSFEPDVLTSLVLKKMNKHQLNDYIVEVQSCLHQHIEYSFSTKRQKQTGIEACRQRVLPMGCYELYFTPLISESPSSQDKFTSAYPLWLLMIFSLGVGLIGLFLMKKKKPISNNVASSLIQIGEYTYDHAKMILSKSGENISLSGKENELLHKLILHKNEVVSKENLLNSVWNDDGNYVGRTLDVYISKLRKKIQADPSLTIINIRGVGYKLQES